MQIVFRTDASTAIGSGHMVRCLTLARALKEAGARTLFVCRPHDGHLGDWIAAEGHTMALLPPPSGVLSDSDTYAGWLGGDAATDAAQTLAAIESAGFDVDWVIVDHYGISAEWEDMVGAKGSRIMVIDDMANRRHSCDILLDQNLVADLDTRYDGLVSSRAAKLLGPRYVLLQPDYRRLHEQSPVRPANPSRLLCYFGASDPHGLTLAAVEAIAALERPEVSADIVLGPYTTDSERIVALASATNGIAIHSKLPSLAELMMQADLALGAGGATSWERICLGLPALVVTFAENQRPIASALHDRQLARWLGEGLDMNRDRLHAELEENMRPGGTAWFNRGFAAGIDGRGTERVVRTILEKSGDDRR